MTLKIKTVEEQVTDQLRDHILRGKFERGERLQQDDLAAELGVSRIPIRSALRTLEAEGLVHFKAHKGVEVTNLSPADLSELFDIRIVLEGHATALAVPRLNDGALEQMRDAFLKMEQALDPQERVALNSIFHHTLYAVAERPRLLGLIKSLRNQVEPYLRIHFPNGSEEQRQAQREHEAILKACERGDVAGARRATQQHLSRVLETLLADNSVVSPK